MEREGSEETVDSLPHLLRVLREEVVHHAHQTRDRWTRGGRRKEEEGSDTCFKLLTIREGWELVIVVCIR